jgi:hypothetical protein
VRHRLVEDTKWALSSLDFDPHLSVNPRKHSAAAPHVRPIRVRQSKVHPRGRVEPEGVQRAEAMSSNSSRRSTEEWGEGGREWETVSECVQMGDSMRGLREGGPTLGYPIFQLSDAKAIHMPT